MHNFVDMPGTSYVSHTRRRPLCSLQSECAASECLCIVYVSTLNRTENSGTEQKSFRSLHLGKATLTECIACSNLRFVPKYSGATT